MFLLSSSEPSLRQVRVGSKSEKRKLSLWGPGPEQAIEAKASHSLLVFNSTRSLDTVHIAFESKDGQANWSTDDPCALTRPPPKKKKPHCQLETSSPQSADGKDHVCWPNKMRQHLQPLPIKRVSASDWKYLAAATLHLFSISPMALMPPTLAF